jgi:hypothetical protein
MISKPTNVPSEELALIELDEAILTVFALKESGMWGFHRLGPLVHSGQALLTAHPDLEGGGLHLAEVYTSGAGEPRDLDR